MLPAGGNPIYYVEDMLGTSRLITTNNGTVCYDADFDPFGGEHPYTNICPQNYKFEGKERDTETGNDDFGARSYSSRFGRWLSADWSSVPVPVPYANLTNPQTLNLYSMVSDDPESFADLDGHTSAQMYQLATPGAGSAWDPMGAGSMTDDSGLTLEEFNALEAAQAAQAAQAQETKPELVVTSAKERDTPYGSEARTQIVNYSVVSMDSKGQVTPVENPKDHKLELKEKQTAGKPLDEVCHGQCVVKGVLPDGMSVTAGKGHSVEKRFEIDGKAARIYDPGSKKAYDFVRVDASVKKGFVFNYGNDPQ